MISIIIPTYNCDATIGETLRRALRQSGEFELLVVDGGSTDRTCAIAQRFDQVKLFSVPRGRARQLNEGVRHARGDLLLFLHAGTRLPRGALERVQGVVKRGKCGAGGFYQRFDGKTFAVRLASLVNHIRCRIMHILADDQVLFIERRLFESVGGFNENGVLGNADLCLRLQGWTRFALLRPAILAAPEKCRHLRRRGAWRTFGRYLRRVYASKRRHALVNS